MKRPSPEEISVALEIASALLALLVAVFHLVRDQQAKKIGRIPTDPMTILARAAGLSILPQAPLMMYSTFDPSLLCTVQGLRVFFMLSGLSLLYVCVKSVTS